MFIIYAQTHSVQLFHFAKLFTSIFHSHTSSYFICDRYILLALYLSLSLSLSPPVIIDGTYKCMCGWCYIFSNIWRDYDRSDSSDVRNCHRWNTQTHVLTSADMYAKWLLAFTCESPIGNICSHTCLLPRYAYVGARVYARWISVDRLDGLNLLTVNRIQFMRNFTLCQFFLNLLIKLVQ